MRNLKIRAFGALTALLLGSVFLAGCGGGGGGSAPAALTGSPNVNLKISFEGSAAHSRYLAARKGSQSGTPETLAVNISIEGVYSETGKPFAPVTATLDIDPAVGSGTVAMREIPIGVNHLLTASAVFSTGTETILGLIEEVAAGKTTEGAASVRTTAAVRAMQSTAEAEEKSLHQLAFSQFESFLAYADLLYEGGTPYQEIQASQLTDFAENDGVAETIQIAPSSGGAAPGETIQFAAAVTDRNGLLDADAEVAWSVTGGGSIDSTGLYTAGGAGTDTVTATSGGATASASIAVSFVCQTDADCDDGDEFTTDVCENAGTASAVCSNAPCTALCSANADCDDSNDLTLDACVNGGTCAAECGHTALQCAADLDCDDGVALTFDACTNPGLETSSCTNTLIECATDAACDDSNNLTTDTCLNPGTLTAACDNAVCGECSSDLDCNDGQAITADICEGANACGAVCTNTTVECAVDADCNDANNLTADTCLNPGTLSAACENAVCGECSVDADCDDGLALTLDVCEGADACGAACSLLEPMLIDTVDAGMVNLVSMAASGDGSKLYVGDSSGNVLRVFDATTDTFGGATISVSGDPKTLTKDPNREKVYTFESGYYGLVHTLDLSSETEVSTISIGSYIYNYLPMAVSASRDEIYVNMGGNRPARQGARTASRNVYSDFAVVDLATESIVQTLSAVKAGFDAPPSIYESGELMLNATSYGGYGSINLFSLSSLSEVQNVTPTSAGYSSVSVSVFQDSGIAIVKVNSNYWYGGPGELHLFDLSTQAFTGNMVLSSNDTTAHMAAFEAASQLFVETNTTDLAVVDPLGFKPLCTFDGLASSSIGGIYADEATRRVYIIHDGTKLSVIEYQDPATSSGVACVAPTCDPTNEADQTCCIGESVSSADCSSPI